MADEKGNAEKSATDDPRAKSGSELASAKTIDRAPGEPVSSSEAEGSFAAKVDALFNDNFVGTSMANDTALWGQCVTFREAVKKFHAETAKA